MKNNKKMLSHCVLFLVPPLLLGGISWATAESDLKMQPFEGALEVRDLKEQEQFADEAALQQVKATELVVQKLETFLAQMQTIGAATAMATKTWIENPTPETEAALTRAVTTAAAQGRAAAATVARLQEEVRHLTQNMQDGLRIGIRGQRTIIQKAQLQTKNLTADLAKAEQTVREAKRLLEAKGYFATGQIPPELEDRLSRLAVDYQELAMRMDIARGLEIQLAHYLTLLEQAERDYKEIDRMTALVAYQAASAERIFGQIGWAESTKIRTKLLADAYGRGSDTRAQLTAALHNMRTVGGTLREVVAAQRQLLQPRKVPSQEEMAQQVTSTGLLDWFHNFGDTQNGSHTGGAETHE
jgi:hypothetical protein